MIVIFELFVGNLDVIAQIIGRFLLLGLVTIVVVGVVAIMILLFAKPALTQKQREQKKFIEQLEEKLTPLGKFEFSHHVGSNYIHLTVFKHGSNEYELKAKLVNEDNREVYFSNEFDSLYPLVIFIQHNYIDNFKDLLVFQRQDS